MGKTPLKYLKIPNYTVPELLEQRMEDWREDGVHLGVRLNRYREDYRQKICVNCDDEQKIKRKCYVYPELDSNGNLKTSCKHMIKAQSKKFKNKINAHLDFHPGFS